MERERTDILTRSTWEKLGKIRGWKTGQDQRCRGCQARPSHRNPSLHILRSSGSRHFRFQTVALTTWRVIKPRPCFGVPPIKAERDHETQICDLFQHHRDWINWPPTCEKWSSTIAKLQNLLPPVDLRRTVTQKTRCVVVGMERLGAPRMQKREEHLQSTSYAEIC